MTLAGEELSVVARAKVQGNAWLQVWIPKLVGAADGDASSGRRRWRTSASCWA